MLQLPQKLNINNKVYVAFQQLGQGAEGAVFKGYEESDPNKNPLAIKICGNMKDDELKFLHKHLLNKDHNNIIKYFEIAIKTPEFPYFVFVMELGQGNLLDKIIQRQYKLEKDEVLEISLQIAKGIQSIHNLGFMHRDMKPENIIFVKDQWKICDFGLSRHKLSSKLTKQIGTAYYIAPEMLFQEAKASEDIEAYDQKVDVWALGCIIYEIYTKNLFFNGNNFDDVCKQVQNYAVRNECGEPEDQRFQNLLEPLKQIVKKMLVVDIEKRITIDDVIKEILTHQEIEKSKKPLENTNNQSDPDVKPPMNIRTTQNLQNQNNQQKFGQIPATINQIPVNKNQQFQNNFLQNQNQSSGQKYLLATQQQLAFQVPLQQPQNSIPFQTPLNQQCLANASNQQNPQTSSQQNQPQYQPPQIQQNPQTYQLQFQPPQNTGQLPQNPQQLQSSPSNTFQFQQINQNFQNIPQGQPQFAMNQQINGQQFPLNPQNQQPMSNAQITQLQQLNQNIFNKQIPHQQTQPLGYIQQQQQNPQIGQINSQNQVPLLGQGGSTPQVFPTPQLSQQHNQGKNISQTPINFKHQPQVQIGIAQQQQQQGIQQQQQGTQQQQQGTHLQQQTKQINFQAGSNPTSNQQLLQQKQTNFQQAQSGKPENQFGGESNNQQNNTKQEDNEKKPEKTETIKRTEDNILHKIAKSMYCEDILHAAQPQDNLTKVTAQFVIRKGTDLFLQKHIDNQPIANQ